MGVCNVIFGWDAGDVVYDNVQFTGWHTGYPDSPAVLDITTFRKIPWENDVPFFLGEFTDQKGNPSEISGGKSSTHKGQSLTLMHKYQ